MSDDPAVKLFDPLDGLDLTEQEKNEINAWSDRLFANRKPWSDRQIERVLSAMRT